MWLGFLRSGRVAPWAQERGRPVHPVTPCGHVVRETTCRPPDSVSLLVTTLVTRLTKQLAVLLLGHALAALLDHRSHGDTSIIVVGAAGTGSRALRASSRPLHSADHSIRHSARIRSSCCGVRLHEGDGSATREVHVPLHQQPPRRVRTGAGQLTVWAIVLRAHACTQSQLTAACGHAGGTAALISHTRHPDRDN
ncbi:Uncharacterised protein [Dermatophilus congolensis]|uniref:Uncharacterized protein n=1 Tax=Dermatophilus congolensis TaxID=1863 RepID=A0A239VAU6_9MICO|nr:Uncharacterised protein [Dermatophilus congolensis]